MCVCVCYVTYILCGGGGGGGGSRRKGVGRVFFK